MMKQYDSYKDSGIEWIGEIPSHWEVKKHKHSISILSGYPFDSDKFNSENGKPLIRIRDITSGYIETYYDGSYDDKYVIRKGDLLIGMDGDFNLRWWDNEEGLLNQRCCKIIEPFHVSKRYLYYILPSELKVINDLTYFTTVKHLSNSDILDNKTLLPPLSEQEHIVSYLDDKTTKIDELIQKKLRKIDLLKEYRTSLINTVVTKGLNSNVPMKDSGIEWIGEIPSHWEKNKLKNLIIQKPDNGLFKKKDDFGEGVRFVNVSDLFNLNNIIDVESLVRVSVSDNELNKSELELGDIFFVRSSLKLEGIGVSSIILNMIEPVVFDCHIIRIKPNKFLIFPKFLIYLLNTLSYRSYLVSISETVTMTTISQDKIKDLILSFPPTSEQEHIVSYLDEKTSQIDKTIDMEKKKIELLKEYRQSLISNVVTGKINISETV